MRTWHSCCNENSFVTITTSYKQRPRSFMARWEVLSLQCCNPTSRWTDNHRWMIISVYIYNSVPFVTHLSSHLWIFKSDWLNGRWLTAVLHLLSRLFSKDIESCSLKNPPWGYKPGTVPSLKGTTIVTWCGQYHSKSQQHDRKCTATHQYQCLEVSILGTSTRLTQCTLLKLFSGTTLV